jgi:hypothetical protein
LINQAAQYWNDLEKLYNQVGEHQRMQAERIAKALRFEREWRSAMEGEIAGEVTRIRNDIQDFVNKPLPG